MGIDIKVYDAMERVHQCATVQLDFQLPIRFDLKYRAADAQGDAKADNKADAAAEKMKRPVIVHRAMLGSVERMSAILIEHYAGKWPFWLSPRQIMVIPVAAAFTDYSEWLVKQFMLHGFQAEVDTSGKTFPKKIRDAQLAQWNYIAVVGDKEESEFLVNIRQRDQAQPIGTFALQDFIT